MRTETDFSEHELIVTKTDDILIHHLKKSKTYTQSIKFINTQGIMAVTGDPSAEGQASDSYWSEKLKISSTQDPYEFDSETAKKEIQELREQYDFSEKEKEWLDELEDEADQGEYAYIAKAMDHPGSFDTEMIPHGKTYKYFFKVILDTFDEICHRLALDEEKKIKDDLTKEC